jgi:hypothetical protein
MKVIWAVLCQSSVIDRDTNNISLFNVLEELTAISAAPQEGTKGSTPAKGIPYIFDLVTLWSRSMQEIPEQGYGRVRLFTPEGESPLGSEYEVDLTRYLRLRTRLHISGFPLKGEGIYRFVIDGKSETGDWTPMFEVPLRVVITSKKT